MEWEVGVRLKKEGTYTYLWLSHVDMWQKPTQYCKAIILPVQFQFSRSVMSNSLWSHEPQHARPPCPSPIPGAYSDSCPEYSRLISFRMDWLDLLAVQGTSKSFLQHHSSKASILWCSAFFTVQFSHPYMTTGKTIALTLNPSLRFVLYRCPLY